MDYDQLNKDFCLLGTNLFISSETERIPPVIYLHILRKVYRKFIRNLPGYLICVFAKRFYTFCSIINSIVTLHFSYG
jgi:hypothetical protein